MSEFRIEETADGVVFEVKVVPGSSRSSVEGLWDGMLKVKISAPPEKGKANKSLAAFLADKLGVKKGAVEIISGMTNPVKKVRVTGVKAESAVSLLGLEQ